MSELQTGSFQLMKSLNRSTILNVIRLHGPISRAEIAKLTKLTPPTVTNIVGELLESRLVVESELGESSGGRKPIMLRINSAAFYIVGVYAGVKKVRAITARLDGQVVSTATARLPEQPSSEEYLARIIQVVEQVIADTDPAKRAVLGIGVGSHGLVDADRGVTLFATNLNLRNIPIKAALEEATGLPVEVENDVRALALGESWFGQAQGLSNFICLYVGTGVGSAIFLDNRLYRGASFTAGELGHTTIDPHGPRCNCGNVGCLEAYVSGRAIEQRMRQWLAEGKTSLLREWTAGDLQAVTGENIHRAAQAGDQAAMEILAETGKYLGIGIANLINMLNPSRIILSGGVSRAGDFVMETLKETVEMRALQNPAQNVSIVTSQLGPHAMEIGGVTLFLQKIFTPAASGDIF